jgi:uncharacterized protein YegP (UPF0339 family)
VAAATAEVYARDDGRFAWRIQEANGEIIATDGGQGFENEGDAQRIADLLVVGWNLVQETVVQVLVAETRPEVDQRVNDALGTVLIGLSEKDPELPATTDDGE